MLPTLIRRAAQNAAAPEAAYIARIRELYPPKKVWPPDFKSLSPQEQLRYEKKYKRRLALATARPRWNKFIKLIQLFSIVSVATYAVLFMDWKQESQPFDGVSTHT
ncbi:hypothetical protein M406DRAFT_257371 [Cryphonectria parasitica EP155]|uniref:Uncharacterized protein n=1 Tax=Cryphonectria parasitica (strain ATCC 38755 / EP155) TaxID=660469 RepID=A0A9P4Y2G1_CRYP1|nr:uncharacterized protein M406DRAFT_257371 [Cryphonectria parasitica EP155]KAF3765757.1 hypothetical protein M406DRAFT_257371 [Cryphonectria parasitica EP155]